MYEILLYFKGMEEGSDKGYAVIYALKEQVSKWRTGMRVEK